MCKVNNCRRIKLTSKMIKIFGHCDNNQMLMYFFERIVKARKNVSVRMIANKLSKQRKSLTNLFCPLSLVTAAAPRGQFHQHFVKCKYAGALS